VLYPVIFQKDPREHIGRIAELFIEQKDRDEIITTVNCCGQVKTDTFC
jgi:hypothetical protein